MVELGNFPSRVKPFSETNSSQSELVLRVKQGGHFDLGSFPTPFFFMVS